MSELITIDADMFDVAQRMAKSTLEKFKNQTGHYPNKYNSHLRGKLGEIGCAAWLESFGLDCEPVFRDGERLSEADIIINGKTTHRCEIKT